MRRFLSFHILVGISVVGLAFYLGANRGALTGRGQVIIEDAPGTVVSFRSQTGPLTFTDHDGKAVSEEEFHGSHLLVFFGYTHCPDVCPGNLAAMTETLELLGDEAERVRPIFITFDPDRDTPETLKRYVENFHPRLLGLTGSHEQIDRAASTYGVYYKIVPPKNEGDPHYLIDHSSQTYLVGPDGDGVAFFRHDSAPEEMAATIREALAKSPPRSTGESNGGERS